VLIGRSHRMQCDRCTMDALVCRGRPTALRRVSSRVDKYIKERFLPLYTSPVSAHTYYTLQLSTLFSGPSTAHQATTMSAHTELTSQEDFQKALQVKEQYVFIYAYEGEISQEAEEYVPRALSHTVAAWKTHIP